MISYFQMPICGTAHITLADLTKIRPPYIHFRRRSQEYILYFIVDGELFLKEDGISYHLVKNDLLLLSPDHEHVGQKASTCLFYYVHFHKDAILPYTEGLSTLLPTMQTIRMKGNIDLSSQDSFLFPKQLSLWPKAAKELTDSLEQTIHSYQDIAEYGRAQADYLLGSVLLMISRFFIQDTLKQPLEPVSSQRNQSSYRLVYDILSYFRQHYAEDIDSILIETLFQCSFDYTNRCFKKMTGETMFYSLNRIRIEKASTLLLGHFFTLSEVAERTGFHDVYYFSKVFKKYTGTTPGRYQRTPFLPVL